GGGHHAHRRAVLQLDRHRLAPGLTGGGRHRDGTGGGRQGGAGGRGRGGVGGGRQGGAAQPGRRQDRHRAEQGQFSLHRVLLRTSRSGRPERVLIDLKRR